MTDLAPGTSFVGSVRRSKWLAMYCMEPCRPLLSQVSRRLASSSNRAALAIPQKSKPIWEAYCFTRVVWCEKFKNLQYKYDCCYRRAMLEAFTFPANVTCGKIGARR